MTVTGVEPSARTDAGAPVTVEVEVLTAAGLTVTGPPEPLSAPSPAETVCEPAVFSVAEKAYVPASPPTKVCEPSAGACGSVLVRFTVPR